MCLCGRWGAQVGAAHKAHKTNTLAPSKSSRGNLVLLLHDGEITHDRGFQWNWVCVWVKWPRISSRASLRLQSRAPINNATCGMWEASLLSGSSSGESKLYRKQNYHESSLNASQSDHIEQLHKTSHHLVCCFHHPLFKNNIVNLR